MLKVCGLVAASTSSSPSIPQWEMMIDEKNDGDKKMRGSQSIKRQKTSQSTAFFWISLLQFLLLLNIIERKKHRPNSFVT